ncbi:hypothetical protein BKA62DRAFT_712339, partial [Auriculariales sp. MPI-PUGE-AT-0066]
LLPTMTSVLSVKHDVLQLVNLPISVHAQDTLWDKLTRGGTTYSHTLAHSLKTTSADVATWPGVSSQNQKHADWDGCVYGAYIETEKITQVEVQPTDPPHAKRQQKQTSAPDPKDRIFTRIGLDTLGIVLTAPATLGDLFAPRAAYTPEQLATIEQNVRRRARSSIDGHQGTFLKYGTAHLRRIVMSPKVHLYLFDRWLRVFEDATGFNALNASKGTYLRELYTIRLDRIGKLVPLLALYGNTFLITVEYLNPDGISSSLVTIAFPKLANAIGWYMMLARLRYRCIHPQDGIHPNLHQVEDAAILPDFLLAMNAWTWQRFPNWTTTDDIGDLVYHGLVSNTTHVQSTFLACVFPDRILFLSQHPQGESVLYSTAELDEVISLHDRSYTFRWGSRRVLAITTGLKEPEDTRHLIEHKEFTFDVGQEESAYNAWKAAIRKVVPVLKFSDLSSGETVATAKTSAPKIEIRAAEIDQPTIEEEPEYSGGTTIGKPTMMTHTERVVAGIVFLCSSVGGNQDEYNVIVGVLDDFKSQGIATFAVSRALSIAFEQYRAHRVQARVLHPSLGTAPSSEEEKKQNAQASRAISKFVHLGFTHEGVRRRVVQHPKTGIWQDVTVLAMLDSEWLVRDSRAPPPKLTLWDDLFARHQREHEALKRMEGSGQLKRTRSMETVRDLRSIRDAAPTPSIADARSSAFDSFSSQPPSTSASELGSLSSWDSVSETSDLKSLNSGIDTVHINKTAAAAAAADDAADEYASWDDMDEDEVDEAMDYESD